MLLDHIDWCRAATLYAPVLFSSLQLCGGCSSCAANYAVSSCEAVERWRPCRQLSEPRHYQTPERECVCVWLSCTEEKKKRRMAKLVCGPPTAVILEPLLILGYCWIPHIYIVVDTTQSGYAEWRRGWWHPGIFCKMRSTKTNYLGCCGNILSLSHCFCI